MARREAKGLASPATPAGDFMASMYDGCTNEELRALAAYTVDVLLNYATRLGRLLSCSFWKWRMPSLPESDMRRSQMQRELNFVAVRIGSARNKFYCSTLNVEQTYGQLKPWLNVHFRSAPGFPRGCREGPETAPLA